MCHLVGIRADISQFKITFYFIHFIIIYFFKHTSKLIVVDVWHHSFPLTHPEYILKWLFRVSEGWEIISLLTYAKDLQVK